MKRETFVINKQIETGNFCKKDEYQNGSGLELLRRMRRETTIHSGA